MRSLKGAEVTADLFIYCGVGLANGTSDKKRLQQFIDYRFIVLCVVQTFWQVTFTLIHPRDVVVQHVDVMCFVLAARVMCCAVVLASDSSLLINSQSYFLRAVCEIKHLASRLPFRSPLCQRP